MARQSPHRKTALALLLGLATSLCAAVAPVAAPAQEAAQERLERTREAQHAAAERGRVLTTTIEEPSARVEALGSEVAELRTREVELAADLRRKEVVLARARSELHRAEARLDRVRARLRRAIDALEDLLVGIYKSGQPDVVGVILVRAVDLVARGAERRGVLLLIGSPFRLRHDLMDLNEHGLTQGAPVMRLLPYPLFEGLRERHRRSRLVLRGQPARAAAA